MLKRLSQVVVSQRISTFYIQMDLQTWKYNMKTLCIPITQYIRRIIFTIQILMAILENFAKRLRISISLNYPSIQIPGNSLVVI